MEPVRPVPEVSRVCPRCGSDARDMHFCGTCGLSLDEHEPLPSRTEWERRQASIPWPPPSETGAAVTDGAAAETPAPPGKGGKRRSRTPSRWRSLAEVGAPIAAVGVVAAIVLSSGHDRKIPGALTYDARAKPLLVSLRGARQKQLDQEHSCHGCVRVASDAGGCSGYGANWTCDVRAPIGPRRSVVLETYRVTWANNGCWSAVEDCASPPDSVQRICPPARVEVLQGCIGA